MWSLNQIWKFIENEIRRRKLIENKIEEMGINEDYSSGSSSDSDTGSKNGSTTHGRNSVNQQLGSGADYKN